VVNAPYNLMEVTIMYRCLPVSVLILTVCVICVGSPDV
jgi:hypothetical protein